jgi:hypothetical protein
MDPRFLFSSLLVVGLSAFVSLMVWARERRREREAYYRHEVHKRVADTQGAGAGVLMEVLREEDRIARRQRREAQKVSGLVTIAAGVGVTIFLRIVDARDPDPAYVVGVIPLLVGAALLLYAYVLGPREPR